GSFIKSSPKVLQQFEEAKHRLLELKEWEACMKKDHPEKKKIQKGYQEALSHMGMGLDKLVECLGGKIEKFSLISDIQSIAPDAEIGYTLEDETKGIPIGEMVYLKPKMYSVLLAEHDPKTSDDPDSENPKKKHGIQKAKGVKKYMEEAYTERLENYCKRYEDNDLYSSLEELYELYYHIAKEKNRERLDDEIEQMLKAMAI
ncbi:6277_t:CDS:2, partial [Racocetra fulgida]